MEDTAVSLYGDGIDAEETRRLVMKMVENCWRDRCPWVKGRGGIEYERGRIVSERSKGAGGRPWRQAGGRIGWDWRPTPMSKCLIISSVQCQKLQYIKIMSTIKLILYYLSRSPLPPRAFAVFCHYKGVYCYLQQTHHWQVVFRLGEYVSWLHEVFR